MNRPPSKPRARLADWSIHLLAVCAALPVAALYLIGAWHARQASMALRSLTPPAASPLLPLVTPLPNGLQQPALRQALHGSQQALRWNPFSATARRNLAFLYLLAGDYAGASAELMQLGRFPVYGNIETAERMILYASASRLASDPAQVVKNWQSIGLEAWAFIQAGDAYWEAYADAEADLLYQCALLLAPTSADAWAAWGRFQARSRNLAPAIEGYEKAVQLGRFQHLRQSSVYFDLGRLYYQQGKYEQALGILQAAITADDFASLADKASSLTGMGTIYQRLGRNEEAARMFDLAKRYAPPSTPRPNPALRPR